MPNSSTLTHDRPLDIANLIRGRIVTYAGKFASMTREQFKDIIGAHGGTLSQRVGLGVSLIVVGQKDWSLTKSGTLWTPLREARLLQRRENSRIMVVSEEQFLAGLGLDALRESLERIYSATTVAEILGVAPDRIRAWVRAGLIKPAFIEHGAWHFEFRQVSAAKTICELVRKGVTLARIRKSLEQLQAWMPDAEHPLKQVAILQENGRLLVRLVEGELAEPDGQIQFDFGQPSQEAAPSLKLTFGPRTARDWLEQGLDQEAAGLLKEAVESYRQALHVGGPDTVTCFNLANALRDSGRKPEAAERYWQAVEMDPAFVDSWNNLGAVLVDLGRHDEACEAFRKALDVDGSDSRLHYNLADTLDEMGLGQEAAEHWRAYLNADGQSRWAAHARSRLSAS